MKHTTCPQCGHDLSFSVQLPASLPASRVLHRVSLSELARELSISKSYLHAIEQQERLVQADFDSRYQQALLRVITQRESAMSKAA